jgi:hypothetical protein
MAAHDHLKGNRLGALCACRHDAHDEPCSNSRTEEPMSRTSHRQCGLARRDDAQRCVRHGVARGCGLLNETPGINRGNSLTDDGDEIVAKSVE